MTLYGDHAAALMLPQRPVTTVSSVTHHGTTVDLGRRVRHMVPGPDARRRSVAPLCRDTVAQLPIGADNLAHGQGIRCRRRNLGTLPRLKGIRWVVLRYLAGQPGADQRLTPDAGNLRPAISGSS